MNVEEAAATVREVLATLDPGDWQEGELLSIAEEALDVLIAAAQRADEWRKESKLASALFDHESERADRLAEAAKRFDDAVDVLIAAAQRADELRKESKLASALADDGDDGEAG